VDDDGSRSPYTGKGARPRLAYVDLARGVAVLLMIEAHTLDAWTRFADRRGAAFRDATVLGGFAAPMFLWLAGLGVALGAARAAERLGQRAAIEAACRRGLEIFMLAFLFRLQAWVLTPGGHPVTIFRVDVLNVMGPSMVVAGLLWGLARGAAGRVAWFSAAAILLAMSTPIIRASAAVEALPVWLQWYVRPAGEMTTFTLFPWAAFVFAGAAVGAMIAASGDAGAERRLHTTLAAVGAALVVIGFWAAARPSIYISSSFWTTSPTWFAIRVGILMLALSAMYLLAPPIPAVERLGRGSLFIYWIHVELVYGYASWLWRHRLPLPITAVAYVAFCALMYRAIVFRDRVIPTWRSRRRKPATQAATA
jgi:uncharacterized membrane protein